ncbi:MAG: plastocyanin/azurin family copper-binding protein [Solirubrobacterales bacterium]
MSNETLFYICGIALAVSAVLFSFIGLKVRSFPGRAFPVVVLWFAILIGGATTFAVLHAQDEEKAKAAETEKANKEDEAEAEDEAAAEAPEENAAAPNEGEGEAEQAAAEGPGGTLQLEADPTEIAYDTTKLSSKPGKVTIDLTNPSSLPHDVAIEDEGGEELGASETLAKGKTSVSVDLSPGTYTFFCTVPGHREAGMEGVLTVR